MKIIEMKGEKKDCFMEKEKNQMKKTRQRRRIKEIFKI
jgi:hypothetical protein